MGCVWWWVHRQCQEPAWCALNQTCWPSQSLAVGVTQTVLLLSTGGEGWSTLAEWAAPARASLEYLTWWLRQLFPRASVGSVTTTAYMTPVVTWTKLVLSSCSLGKHEENKVLGSATLDFFTSGTCSVRCCKDRKLFQQVGRTTHLFAKCYTDTFFFIWEIFCWLDIFSTVANKQTLQLAKPTIYSAGMDLFFLASVLNFKK